MAYRSTLEARLARKATRAIKTFDLVEEGDRILVGLSGGKDSWSIGDIMDDVLDADATPCSLCARLRRGVREHPGVKSSMLKALGNVAPRHLLDTRLNPIGDLRAAACSRADLAAGAAGAAGAAAS